MIKSTTTTIKTVWSYRKAAVVTAIIASACYGLLATHEGHMLAWFVFNHASVSSAYAQWESHQGTYLAPLK